jgi:RNA polymerase sigma-70 factor (ECF subfamily)
MNEYKCIKKIRNGDQTALNELIEFLYPQLYRFVYRKLQGDEMTSDIVQDTFVRFVRVIPTYQVQGKIIHYLFKIASNLCIDYWKKKGKEYDYEIEESLFIDEHTDVHFDTLEKLEHEQIAKYLLDLTPQQQDVILLKYFEQLTFKEIAAIYQTNESTIKSRHTQALIKLRRKMKVGETYES